MCNPLKIKTIIIPKSRLKPSSRILGSYIYVHTAGVWVGVGGGGGGGSGGQPVYCQSFDNENALKFFILVSRFFNFSWYHGHSAS